MAVNSKIKSLVAALVCLIAFAPIAGQSAPPVYDNFRGKHVNPTKWRAGSFSTNIVSGYFRLLKGALQMSMRSYADLTVSGIGGTDQAWSNVWLPQDKSDSARELQATVRLRKALASACPLPGSATTFAEFQLRSFWFNDGSTPPASANDVALGDVYSNLSISQSSQPGSKLFIFANVFHVTDTGTERIYSNSLGAVENRTQAITIRTTWDPDLKQLKFYKSVPGEGRQTVVYDYASDVEDVSVPAWRFNAKGMTLRGFPAYCRKIPIYAEVFAIVEQFRMK